MRRGEKFRPRSSLRLSRASLTAGQLSRGSPMPMKTRLRSTGQSGRVSPRCSRATRICPRISPMLRLRAKPILPVAQKVQAMAQPTCEERHWLQRRLPSRASEGMSTLSTSAPSSMRRRNLTVPSRLSCVRATSGHWMRARRARRSRQAREMSLMPSKSRAILRHSHCQSWTARNFGSWSSSRIQSMSAGSVKSRRLTRSSGEGHMARFKHPAPGLSNAKRARGNRPRRGPGTACCTVPPGRHR